MQSMGWHASGKVKSTRLWLQIEAKAIGGQLSAPALNFSVDCVMARAGIDYLLVELHS